MFKKISLNIIIAILISASFLCPDYLFSLFHKSYNIEFQQLKYFKILFVFGLVIAFTKNFKLIKIVFIILGILEIIQFSHFAYFNDYLDPYSIYFIFSEAEEIGLVVFNSVFSLGYVPFLVIMPYFISFWIIRKTWDRQLKVRFTSIVLILFLIFPAIRIPFRDDLLDVFPMKKLPSLVNTLNTYSVFFTAILPHKLFSKNNVKFEPYKIIKEKNIEKSTIIIVMGESFSFQRMNLFGAERNTNPNLNLLAQDKNFIYKKSLSAAVSTRSTLPIFYNIQYNPLDRNPIEKHKSNMFLLAKESGFKTFYISAQSSNCLTGIGLQGIDFVYTKESNEKLFTEYQDEGLLKIISSQKLGDKNFIVLHQRNIHAPFEENYSHRKEFLKFPIQGSYEEQNINAYDNGVLYNDFILSEIIKYFKENTKNPLYIFITSDHGEELWEEGYFGHTKTRLGSAKVPFLFYSSNANQEIINEIKDLYYPHHYEIGVLILKTLGYKLINPNFKENTFYINGSAAFGDDGYIELVKLKNKEIEYKVINPMTK